MHSRQIGYFLCEDKIDKISPQTMQSAFDEGHWIKMYLIEKTGVESSNRPNKRLTSIKYTSSELCNLNDVFFGF